MSENAFRCFIFVSWIEMGGIENKWSVKSVSQETQKFEKISGNLWISPASWGTLEATHNQAALRLLLEWLSHVLYT